MAENTSEVIVGGLVLAVAAGFLFYAANATGFAGSTGGRNEYKASFRAVDGVSVGTDVRLAGVKVGSVVALQLNPQTFYADATVTVDRDIALPDDSALLVSSEGLLGGNFLELVPGGSPTNLDPGAEIEDTQGSVSLISLLTKFVAGSGGGEEPAPAAPAPAPGSE